MEKCLQTAKDAGCPKDQAERLVQSGYIPLPWQWQFHAAAREADKPNGPTDIGCGGARGPGKSHAVLGQAALDDCQRVANLKCLFLRQTGLSAKESFDDLVSKVVKGHVEYEKTGNLLKFPNGSRVLLGGFQDENDIDKYVGIEYDVILVEELNQLTEKKYQMLRGSLRTSKTNWRPRMYTSFNPGGRGHTFVKSRYIEPSRQMNEKQTRFVGSTYQSNPYLNKEYIDYLEGLSGDLGKAWREGEWDLFAGQYFTEWRSAIHVCRPFTIPYDWKHFCALDGGYAAPASIGWYAISPDGILYRYKELYVTKHTGSMLGSRFVEMTEPNEKIQYIVADPAFWSKRGESDDALSTAEKFENKVKELNKNSDLRCPAMIRGNNDRITGWNEVHEWLKPFEKEEGELTARVQIFSTCTEFIRTFPALQHDTNNPEDVDSDGEDHAADEFRYAIMSRPKPSVTSQTLANIEFQQAMMRKKQGRGRSGKGVFIQ